MFLRRTERKKNGKSHHYWNVVENRRLDDGRVVQRHVLYLGEINSLAGRRLAQGDRGVRRGCWPLADTGAFSRRSVRGGRWRCIGGSASAIRHAASSPATGGRLLVGRAVMEAA